MSMRSTIKQFDTHVTGWVNQVFSHDMWRPFFHAVTVLGDPITIILITVGIVATGLYVSSSRLVVSGVAVPIVVAVGGLIKLLVERARPVSDYSANLATFSFPSGHSTGSMVAFGLLAYFAYMKLPGVWGVGLAALLLLVPIAVGISRVYLGAHYPSDVLAGWLLGLVGLAVIILVARPLG